MAHLCSPGDEALFSKINSPLDEEKFHKRQPFVLSASFLSPY
jgi:hypothetical protein